MSIYLRVEITPHDGKQAEFETAAKALVAQAADEPGTLTYRVFAGASGGYTFIEEYVDAAASAEHGKTGRELLAQLGAVATIDRVDVYGGPEDNVEKMAKVFPNGTGHTQAF
ncbi:putative quinol monooxygenase [Kutzneria sp. CA-103260]|uniref:putative quinol monooxygenase n=1 Tax=Kutzneria sp. CA-103260 TaxID=2802641 RepID=UPI001BAC4BF6|nr:antibiotic biosynthesis monooxygenase [Kutzneria sp. CA-103260]